MSALAQQPPPVDAAEIFNNAVRAIFSRWTLLRLAVDQGWADGDEAVPGERTRAPAGLAAAPGLGPPRAPTWGERYDWRATVSFVLCSDHSVRSQNILSGFMRHSEI